MDTLNTLIKTHSPGAPEAMFHKLLETFPEDHFVTLMQRRFPFYQTTFWYPLGQKAGNIFEQVVDSLRDHVDPSPAVIGVEWWFSVLLTNATPQWLLACHFDRNDISEKNVDKIRHPETASVLFFDTVPYGELVITDQTLTPNGPRPRQPRIMRFVPPQPNHYVTFPGHLYHGVLGRMWRPEEATRLRITMAVNWWTERPKAAYLRDSADCMTAYDLK